MTGIAEVDKLFKNGEELIRIYLRMIKDKDVVEIDGFRWPIGTLITSTGTTEGGRRNAEREKTPPTEENRTVPIGYRVTKLNPVNPDNERGKRTWEWDQPGYRITAFRRKKGEEFGNHFHQGLDPEKNPERILLLSGKIAARFVTRNGTESHCILDATDGPVELTIYPWTFHAMKALTECHFIEHRVRPFDPTQSDTYLANEFPIPTEGQYGVC